MKGKKGVRVGSGFLGPIGRFEGNDTSRGHLTMGGGHPGTSDTYFRLHEGHARGEGVLGFGERGSCGHEVASQGGSTCKTSQAQREETEHARGLVESDCLPEPPLR